uniref:CCT domain-containing protein n=1 Tax=Heterosigma akashiwo TaxID=2829 RepID=A0A6V2X5R2_HETAK|mmetsp:Transcript_34309/g.59329  ORF Transcript_34309/g.59329 Transcript_34309/m.59329 type:complete len:410 (-) Transcript_34309:363-1592(-)
MMNSIKLSEEGELTLSNIKFRKESFSLMLDSGFDDDFHFDDFPGPGEGMGDPSLYESSSDDYLSSSSSSSPFEDSPLIAPVVPVKKEKPLPQPPSIMVALRKDKKVSPASFMPIKLEDPDEPEPRERPCIKLAAKRARSPSVDLINAFIVPPAADPRPFKRKPLSSDARDRGLSMDVISTLFDQDDLSEKKKFAYDKYDGPGSLMPRHTSSQYLNAYRPPSPPPMPYIKQEIPKSQPPADRCRSPPPVSLLNDSPPLPSFMTVDLSANVKRVGIYTVEERRRRVARFHAKRQRRVWRKKIKYDCRKKLAESRPRVKGRFVRRGEGGDDAAAAGASPVGGGTSFPPSPSTGCVPVALLPAPVLPVPPPATLLGAERLGRGFLPAELASPALSTFGYQPASFLQQQAATAM